MIYRAEHPNPQFMRNNFQSLNGKWKFTMQRDGEKYEKLIEVPFCPESEKSGCGLDGFIRECEYERPFTISELSEKERLFLHFGAVDYEAIVYINGVKAGKHRGGYTPFGVDITEFVKIGENQLRVVVYDDTDANQPSGKQCEKLKPYRCFYTRTTGIWQTVYLERTPVEYIRSVKFYPNISDTAVGVEVCAEGEGKVEIEVYFDGETVGSTQFYLKYKRRVEIPLSKRKLWALGKGNLYDVKIKYGSDEVTSYFGLREVKYDGYKFLLNGESVFQRLVLDQGYYPEGQYTAVCESQFKEDILKAIELGFNGARLHQKVFEPRYLYHCDKLGFMVWGEFPSWGTKYEHLEGIGDFIGEWVATIERDFNHPSIITWCPLNETWYNFYDDRKIRDVRFIDSVYQVTKAVDSTRPCVDVSGGYHGHNTDLFDVHCYNDPVRLKAHLDALDERGEITTDQTFAPAWTGENIPYGGQPVNVSEYGGTAFVTSDDNGWGYRQISTESKFIDDYVTLTSILLRSKKLSGFCYTQLYDIEQEQNGLLTASRNHKFSKESRDRIRACNSSKASIED